MVEGGGGPRWQAQVGSGGADGALEQREWMEGMDQMELVSLGLAFP